MDNNSALSQRTISRGNRKDSALFRPPADDTISDAEPSVVTTVSAIQQDCEPPQHPTRCRKSRSAGPDSLTKKSLSDAQVRTEKFEYVDSGPAPPLQEKRSLRSRCDVCGQFGHGVDDCPRKNTKKQMPILSATKMTTNDTVSESVSSTSNGDPGAKLLSTVPTTNKTDEWKVAFLDQQVRSSIVGKTVSRVPTNGMETTVPAELSSAFDKAGSDNADQKNIQDLTKLFQRVLFLRNLTVDASDDQVRDEFFRGLGLVDFLRSTNALNGMVCDKGWAFMESQDETEKAQNMLHGRDFLGIAVSVELVNKNRCPKMAETGFIHPPAVLPATSAYMPNILRGLPHDIVPNFLPDVSLDSRHMRALTSDFEVFPNVANKQCHITKWLAGLPKHSLQLLEPSSTPAYHTSLYQDWFFWSDTRGRLLLHKLDKYETQHRGIGLKYHMLPYNLRHAKTYNDGVRMSQQAMARLAGVYETNIPYNIQLLYQDWIGVVNAVIMAADEVQRVKRSTSTQVLGETHERVISLLDSVEKNVQRIVTSLHGMEQLVETLRPSRTAAPRESNDETIKRLKNENTNEGRSIRRWVWTWPDVQANLGSGTLAHVEELLSRLLVGEAEMCTFWRNSVP